MGGYGCAAVNNYRPCITWLNRLAFVGTLQPLAPRPAVLVRVFSLAV